MSEPAAQRSTAGVARREAILRSLQAAGFVSVTTLTSELGVSDMTVRRDLRQLADEGHLRVIHGGASLPHGTLRTADFASRGERLLQAKRRIAQRALQLVTPGSTIAIDAGTTPFELAAGLPEDFGGCVITHSVPVLQHLLYVPSARVIGLGGELLADSQALVGTLTIDAMAGLHADTVFLGAAAVSRRGLFVSTHHERPTKLALCGIADRVVLLVDHSKFTTTAPVALAPLDSIDVIVTDAALDPALATACARADVEVVRADQSPPVPGSPPARATRAGGTRARGGSSGPG